MSHSHTHSCRVTHSVQSWLTRAHANGCLFHTEKHVSHFLRLFPEIASVTPPPAAAGSPQPGQADQPWGWGTPSIGHWDWGSMTPIDDVEFSVSQLSPLLESDPPRGHDRRWARMGGSTPQGSERGRKAVGVLQILGLPRTMGMVGSDHALSPVPGHSTGKVLACLSPDPLPHPFSDRLGRQGASLWPHGDRPVTPTCGLWDRNCTSLSPPWLVTASSKMASGPVPQAQLCLLWLLLPFLALASVSL